MMRALISKELRTLLPFAWLILGMMALVTGSLFAMEMPDSNTLDPKEWLDNDRPGILAYFLLFALMIGSGLLVNENEQGTLTFLDSLPVSRTRIFIAKVIAGLLVLSIGPVIGLGIDVGLDWISRDSTDGPLPWRFLFFELGLELVVAVYLLSLAVAFSFLRKWFALVVGLIFWGYLYLKESGPDWVALFDPYDALDLGVANGGFQIPWNYVTFQLSAAAVAIFAAWLAFQALGDRIQHAIDRFQRHRFLHAIGTGMRFFAPVVWIAAIVKLGSDSPSDGSRKDSVTGGEAEFGSRETKYYEFLFRNSQDEMATPMIKKADDVHRSVTKFFSAEKTDVRIVVDLASPVAPHAAAQTTWTKIRLPLDESVDFQRFERVLGHETAHVYIEQLSSGRTSKLFSYCRFLHEGLATYVEHEYFATEDQKLNTRREAAAAWSRGKIPFATLCDDPALGSSRDRNIVYPVGYVFMRALVDTHGKDSVARLIRALARPDAPLGLKGATLWRDTMQAADIALDRVEAAYEIACEELLKSEAEYVAKFPRITAEITREGDEIVIKPKFEGTAPCRMVCARYDSDFLGNDTRYMQPRKDGSFRFSRLGHPAEKIRYMLGWVENEQEFAIWEPWVEAAMP